jgi:hypothetical protein
VDQQSNPNRVKIPLAKEGPDNFTQVIPSHVAVTTHRSSDPNSLKSCVKNSTPGNRPKQILSPTSQEHHKEKIEIEKPENPSKLFKESSHS